MAESTTSATFPLTDTEPFDEEIDDEDLQIVVSPPEIEINRVLQWADDHDEEADDYRRGYANAVTDAFNWLFGWDDTAPDEGWVDDDDDQDEE